MPPPASLAVLAARSTWLSRVVPGAMLGVLAACTGSELVLPADGRPTSIEIVDGNGQSGEAGDLLAPVIVAVKDARGQPVPGATVVFELTLAGDGADIDPPSATTDSIGRASAQMLLGQQQGVQTGEARVLVEATTAASVSFTAMIEPGTPNPNRPPRADYNWHCEGLTCQFTDASEDEDGDVRGWDWRFGDGSSSTEREPAHTYEDPGTYTVTLTVTDDRGATDDSEAHVDVEDGDGDRDFDNKAPKADFDVECPGLICAFIDRSKDDDGNIVAWRWDFGDGTSSTEQYPIHSYSSEGHYEVMLTVTDDSGAPDIKTRNVEPKM